MIAGEGKSLIIFFSKVVIWDSLSKISFKVTLTWKAKNNPLSFLGVAVRHHRPSVPVKQNQAKTEHIPPNLSKKGVLNKQHSALV